MVLLMAMKEGGAGIVGSDEDMAARPESSRSSRRDNIRWILYRQLLRHVVLSMLLTITIGILPR